MPPRSANPDVSAGTPLELVSVPAAHSDSDESLLVVPDTGRADEQYRESADTTAD